MWLAGTRLGSRLLANADAVDSGLEKRGPLLSLVQGIVMSSIISASQHDLEIRGDNRESHLATMRLVVAVWELHFTHAAGINSHNTGSRTPLIG